MSGTNQTTDLPELKGRESRHSGPVPLDYERGEFWMHGIDKAGKAVCAPCMVQREDESLEEFVRRVREVEEAIP